MLILLGPIVAQLVTVSAADRTEGRVAIVETTPTYTAVTRPAVDLDLTQKRFRLQLLYSPSLTLTPLESNPQLLVFHTGGFTAGYTWRRSSLTVSQFVGYGEINFQVLATAGGATPLPTMQGTGTGEPNNGTGTTGTGTTGTGTTGTGTTGTGTTTGGPTPLGGTGLTGSTTGAASAIHILNQNVRYVNSTSSAGMAHSLSAAASVTAGLAYTVAGAVGGANEAQYPTIRGPLGTVTLSDRIDRWNTIGTALSAQSSTASDGSAAWVVGSGERWSHDFNHQTSAQLGAGISGGRNSRSDGYVAYSIYPTFLATLASVTRLTPGSLTLGFSATSAPAVYPITLEPNNRAGPGSAIVIDPRLSLLASAAWERRRVSASLAGGTAFSVSGQQQSALSTVSGSGGIAYQFGKAFSMDGGIRVAYQVYQGQAVLPFTYAAYLGMTFGFSAPLR